jgi:polyphosphate kinase
MINSKQNLILNREIGLIKFYQRILAQTLDKNVPLLERFKYLCIVSKNLDELFEVRIARLIKWSKADPTKVFEDGATANQSLRQIKHVAIKLYDSIYRTYNSTILPELHDAKINLKWNKIDTDKKWLHHYFSTELKPQLTPTLINQSTQFPLISSKNLCFIVELKNKHRNAHKDHKDHDKNEAHEENELAILEVPRTLPHIIRLPLQGTQDTHTISGVNQDNYNYILLQDLIKLYLADFFPNHVIQNYYPFRITRASDFSLNTDIVSSRKHIIHRGFAKRKYAICSRIEIDINNNGPENWAPPATDYLINTLLTKFALKSRNIYFANGPLNISRLLDIISTIRQPKLKFPKFTPVLPNELIQEPDIFKAITKSDILIHTPYQSFDPVIELTRRAAIDPKVVAIKMTVYRTGIDSQLVRNLIKAAQANKQVFVTIELFARADEDTNITLATKLENAGAHVVYGITGCKVHAKMLLIIRQEDSQTKYYAHLGTGNYHQLTSKTYCDFGLLTTNPVITQDIEAIFTSITGIGFAHPIRTIYQSPFNMFDMLIQKIEQETVNAKRGIPATIIAKMNSLQEPKIIHTLYIASQAGVKITLIVRGACALRPKIKGISDNITVISIVGRFLEHHRVFYFYNLGREDVFLSSADWMKRNFFKRIEICIPILEKHVKQRIIHEGLMVYITDNSTAWVMDTHGNYTRRQSKNHDKITAAQTILMHELNLDLNLDK